MDGGQHIQAPGLLGGPLGIVIPGYGHPKFLGEAIISACTQNYGQAIYVVVVDDGCRFAETAEAVQDLQQQFPDRLFYIRQANKRLPGARNTGVRFLLDMVPDLDAVFFLDADNRLSPSSMQSYRNALGDNPAVGWAYPDITFIGLTQSINGYDTRTTSPAYSVLRHLVGNISEAGSMVRADVFRDGVFFDETMRHGFEDWDFWLSALEKGYTGIRAKNSGFFYRRRAESMLSDARRLEDGLLAQMYRKHAALFTPRHVMKAEHTDNPPYAIILMDRDEVILTGDPLLAGQTMPIEAFRTVLQDWLFAPNETFVPSHLLFMPGALWDDMKKETLLLRKLFWDIRDKVNKPASLALIGGQDVKMVLHDTTGPAGDLLPAALVPFHSLMKKDLWDDIGKTKAAFIFPDNMSRFAQYEGDISGLKEQLENMQTALDEDTVLVRHKDRRFAGPTPASIHEKLIAPVCAEEGRTPYPCAMGNDQIYISVADTVEDTNYQEQIKEQLSALSGLISKNKALHTQICLETISGASLLRMTTCVKGLQIARKTDFTSYWTTSDTLIDYRKTYLGHQYSRSLEIDDSESVGIQARSASIWISLGNCDQICILGKARHYGTKTYVWVPSSLKAHPHIWDEMKARILAFEHAIDYILCDDAGMVAILTAEGVPPGKILSSQDGLVQLAVVMKSG